MHHRAATIQVLWDDAERRKGLADTDVLKILIETRKLLESRGLREKYPILYLYCDWIAHASIDRNDMARRALDTLSDHFTSLIDELKRKRLHPEIQSPQQYFQKSLERIGPAALRRDWLNLHQEYGIRTRPLDSQQDWYPLYGLVLRLLKATPIELHVAIVGGKNEGTRANVRLYEQMLARAGGNSSLVPTRIEVCPGRDLPVDDAQRDAIRKSGGDPARTLELIATAYCWVVRTTPDMNMWIVILPDEPPSAFSLP
jgi:hypothetical protein